MTAAEGPDKERAYRVIPESFGGAVMRALTLAAYAMLVAAAAVNMFPRPYRAWALPVQPLAAAVFLASVMVRERD